jgi:hypothetical protein
VQAACRRLVAALSVASSAAEPLHVSQEYEAAAGTAGGLWCNARALAVAVDAHEQHVAAEPGASFAATLQQLAAAYGARSGRHGLDLDAMSDAESDADGGAPHDSTRRTATAPRPPMEAAAAGGGQP